MMQKSKKKSNSNSKRNTKLLRSKTQPNTKKRKQNSRRILNKKSYNKTNRNKTRNRKSKSSKKTSKTSKTSVSNNNSNRMTNTNSMTNSSLESNSNNQNENMSLSNQRFDGKLSPNLLHLPLKTVPPQCCICSKSLDENVDNPVTLIPSQCKAKYRMNGHRLCDVCWFEKFALEGTSHQCPGCIKNIPLTFWNHDDDTYENHIQRIKQVSSNNVMINNNGVIDLT